MSTSTGRIYELGIISFVLTINYHIEYDFDFIYIVGKENETVVYHSYSVFENIIHHVQY
jgi:hypothetical protein